MLTAAQSMAAANSSVRMDVFEITQMAGPPGGLAVATTDAFGFGAISEVRTGFMPFPPEQWSPDTSARTAGFLGSIDQLSYHGSSTASAVSGYSLILAAASASEQNWSSYAAALKGPTCGGCYNLSLAPDTVATISFELTLESSTDAAIAQAYAWSSFFMQVGSTVYSAGSCSTTDDSFMSCAGRGSKFTSGRYVITLSAPNDASAQVSIGLSAYAGLSSPVPEPSPAAVITLGLGSLFAMRKRPR